MDVTVLFSPTHGFWSDHGWSDHISQATRLPSGAIVQISFKSTRNIRRIRLLACQQLSHIELMRLTLTMMRRNDRPSLMQSFFRLYQCDPTTPKDDDELFELCRKAPIASLGRMVAEHSHYDVYAGERLDDVVMVPREHSEPIEKAPLIPPFIVAHPERKKRR